MHRGHTVEFGISDKKITVDNPIGSPPPRTHMAAAPVRWFPQLSGDTKLAAKLNDLRWQKLQRKQGKWMNMVFFLAHPPNFLGTCLK